MKGCSCVFSDSSLKRLVFKTSSYEIMWKDVIIVAVGSWGFQDTGVARKCMVHRAAGGGRACRVRGCTQPLAGGALSSLLMFSFRGSLYLRKKFKNCGFWPMKYIYAYNCKKIV